MRVLSNAVFLFALVPFFLGAAQKPQMPRQHADHQHDPITEDLSQGARFPFKIAPDLPEFTLKVIPHLRKPDQYGNPQTTIEDIQVFRGNSSRPLQSLEGCEWEGMEAPPRDSEWVRMEDMNFDGYKDIYVLTNWGATGNESGCVWLYDPGTGRFDYSKEFSKLATYSLDPTTKTIITQDNGGRAGMVFRATKYAVKNNRPVPIIEVAQDWDFGKQEYHCVVRQRRGREGALVTIRDKWMRPGKNDEGPCDPGEPFRSVSDK